MDIFIETHGCELNKAESSSISLLLKDAGHNIAKDANSADVIIINTCSVRQSAETKVFGQLGVYKPLHDSKKAKIILTGCMAEGEGDALLKQFPFIDFIIPNNEKSKIVQVISSIADGTNFVHKIPDKYEFFDIHYTADSIENYIPIQNGCDNFCSYCIVPFTRGREISRNPDDIMREIDYQDENGVRIVTLLGQNVNSYRYENTGFEELVKRIDGKEYKNIKWFNFESPHPKDFSDELIALLASSSHFTHHFHIPIQSANDRILSLMNRRYKKSDIISLFSKIRSAMSDATFSSDIMMGFPTESDKEAQETIDFVKEIGFLDNFMYYYNPRPHTIAASRYEDLPLDVKKSRLEELIKVQREISYKERRKFIGREVDVIAKGPSKDGNMLAVTSQRLSVIIHPDAKVGDMLRLKVRDVVGSTLIGQI